MEIKNLTKAVKDYNEYNKGGLFSPEYGRLMFDMDTGELWTDRFYDLGHNEYNVYHSSNIVNIDTVISWGIEYRYYNAIPGGIPSGKLTEAEVVDCIERYLDEYIAFVDEKR
ncbi:MAG: hypothetical protein LUH08_02525 [Ruminococcus sp.]|nr:hypothetical protein [Ruminococcus sp.]